MVRKALFLILLVGLSITKINAQDEFKSEWNVGVGFGPTFASLDFDPKVKTKNIQQVFGGVSIRYLSEKNLGLIAELNYAQQGWEGDFPDNPEFTHQHKLNYLEIPIMTHIYFGNKVRFFVNLGPKISFLLSEKETLSDDLTSFLASGNVPVEMPTGHYYQKAQTKIDYAIMGGAGMEVRTGIGNFALEGRYSFGMGDIYKNSRANHYGRSANRVIGAKLTYYVKLF